MVVENLKVETGKEQKNKQEISLAKPKENKSSLHMRMQV